MKRWLLILLFLPLVAAGCNGMNFYYKNSAGGFYGYDRTISVVNNVPIADILVNGIKKERLKQGDVWTFTPDTVVSVITARVMTSVGPQVGKEHIINNYDDYRYGNKQNTTVYIEPRDFDYPITP